MFTLGELGSGEMVVFFLSLAMHLCS